MDCRGPRDRVRAVRVQPAIWRRRDAGPRRQAQRRRVASHRLARGLDALAEPLHGGRVGDRAVVVDGVAPARGDLHRLRLARGDPDRRDRQAAAPPGRCRARRRGRTVRRTSTCPVRSSVETISTASPKRATCDAASQPNAGQRRSLGPDPAPRPRTSRPALVSSSARDHRREQRGVAVAGAHDERPDLDAGGARGERRQDRPALPEAGLVGDPQRVHAQCLGVDRERADPRPSRRDAIGARPRRCVQADPEGHSLTMPATVPDRGRRRVSAARATVIRDCKPFDILSPARRGPIMPPSSAPDPGARRCPGPAAANDRRMVVPPSVAIAVPVRRARGPRPRRTLDGARRMGRTLPQQPPQGPLVPPGRREYGLAEAPFTPTLPTATSRTAPQCPHGPPGSTHRRGKTPNGVHGDHRTRPDAHRE